MAPSAEMVHKFPHFSWGIIQELEVLIFLYDLIDNKEENKCLDLEAVNATDKVNKGTNEKVDRCIKVNKHFVTQTQELQAHQVLSNYQ